MGGASLTTTGLVVTIIKCFIGSGILFLPKAFSNGGWLFSAASMAVFAWLTNVCVMKLIACRALLPRGTSYGGIGAHVAGFWGARAVDTSLVLSQAGFCCVYVSFVARNVIQLLNDLPGKGCWVSSQWLYVLILCEFLWLAPLTWVRRLASFEGTNLVADVCIGVGLLAVLAWAGAGMAARGAGAGGAPPEPLQAIGTNWPLMLGTAVYAFEGAGMVVPMVNALPPAGRRTFPATFTLTLAGVSVLYVAVGLVPYAYIVGYGGSGGLVQDCVTLNLPRAWWSYCVVAGYCLALTFSYPFMMFPAMRALEAGVAPWLFPEAVVVPEGGEEGGEEEEDDGGGDGAEGWSEKGGAGAAGGGGGRGKRAARGGEPQLELFEAPPSPAGDAEPLLVDSAGMLAEADAALGRSTAAQSWRTVWKVNAFRSLVVAATLLVAVLGASQLDNMVSLIGAFCCTPIAFIFPAWFHAVMVARPGGKRAEELVDWAIVALGCGIMVFTTYQSIKGWGTTEFDACLP
jgi:amino acid permease